MHIICICLAYVETSSGGGTDVLSICKISPPDELISTPAEL